MSDNRFLAEIQIDSDELAAIMKDLDAAKETIYKCYDRLSHLEILRIKKEDTASGN